MKIDRSFEQQYQCEPCEPSPSEHAALILWARYEVACESYDRVVCTGQLLYGRIMPVTSWEKTTINRNAVANRRYMMQIAEERYIPPEAMAWAKRYIDAIDDLRRLQDLADLSMPGEESR